MQAHTADMINGLRDLIRFLSSVTHAASPARCSRPARRPACRSSLPGDRLKGTIDGIGSMTLDVAAES